MSRPRGAVLVVALLVCDSHLEHGRFVRLELISPDVLRNDCWPAPVCGPLLVVARRRATVGEKHRSVVVGVAVHLHHKVVTKVRVFQVESRVRVGRRRLQGGLHLHFSVRAAKQMLRGSYHLHSRDTNRRFKFWP